MLRRRAEAHGVVRSSPTTAPVRAYFAANPPLTGKGRLALRPRRCSRRATAPRRRRWCAKPGATMRCSAEIEVAGAEEFGALLQPGDDKARMERRLYANDDTTPACARPSGSAARSSRSPRLRIAVTDKARQGQGAGRSGARTMRATTSATCSRSCSCCAAPTRSPKPAQLMLHGAERRHAPARSPTNGGSSDGCSRASCSTSTTQGPPIRWRATPRRRARKSTRSRASSPPAGSRCASSTIRNSPAAHFARIPEVTDNPISLSRAGYWMGRAAEAANRPQEARKHYEAAAQLPTAYYGQIARATARPRRHGADPCPAADRRAARLGRHGSNWCARRKFSMRSMNAISLVPLMADLGDKLDDIGALVALGEITARYNDARAHDASSARPRSRAVMRSSNTPSRPSAFRTTRRSARRSSRRSSIRSCGQESCVQPRDVSERPGHGPDAGHAGRRQDTCKRVRRARSTRSGC